MPISILSACESVSSNRDRRFVPSFANRFAKRSFWRVIASAISALPVVIFTYRQLAHVAAARDAVASAERNFSSVVHEENRATDVFAPRGSGKQIAGRTFKLVVRLAGGKAKTIL